MEDVIAKARYSCLTWNAPLDETHANELLGHLKLSSYVSIIDLGCGWGELLLRAIASTGAKGTGVDTDEAGLIRARVAAKERGLNSSFFHQPAEDWLDTRDRAICIGSSHALGGSRAMLQRLAKIVPKGRVLVGDTC